MINRNQLNVYYAHLNDIYHDAANSHDTATSMILFTFNTKSLNTAMISEPIRIQQSLHKCQSQLWKKDHTRMGAIRNYEWLISFCCVLWSSVLTGWKSIQCFIRAFCRIFQFLLMLEYFSGIHYSTQSRVLMCLQFYNPWRQLFLRNDKKQPSSRLETAGDRHRLWNHSVARPFNLLFHLL